MAALTGSFLAGNRISQAAAGKWRRGASMPYRTQEIYPARLGTKIYVVGGLSPDFMDHRLGLSDQTLVYDIARNTWQTGPGFPEPSHHVNCIGYGGKLYAAGGFTLSNSGRWKMRQSLHVYDPAFPRSGWRQLTSMPLPQAESVLFASDGLLHLISGRTPSSPGNDQWQDHTDTDRHQIYNVSGNNWMLGPNCPTPRNSAAGATVDGNHYLIGGRTVSGGNVADVTVLSGTGSSPGASDQAWRWESLPSMPQAQGGLAAAALNSKIYVFGGEYASFFGNGVFSDTWCFDPSRQSWQPASPMPTPRHGLGAIAYDNEIFLLGGAREAGAESTSDVVTLFEP